MPSPSVSVVVRTSNRPWFLRRALTSIAAQQVSDIEVVVVNDGGLPEPVDDAVKSFSSSAGRLTILHESGPLGRGAAWNRGVNSASGDWIASLDDDDTWAPTFLSETLKLGARAGGAVAVVCRTTLVTEEPVVDGYREIQREPFNARLTNIRIQDLVLANRFTNNALIFPRVSLADVGLYRTDLPVLEDWEFNVRYAARFPIVVSPAALANYHRRRATNCSSDANTQAEVHQAVRDQIKEEWLREDLQSGRFGKGYLALLAEVESNRGLRSMNRVVDWLRG